MLVNQRVALDAQVDLLNNFAQLTKQIQTIC